MAHVLIFEPHVSGHRAIFVRHLVESMARNGGMRATWAVLGEDRQHSQIRTPEAQFGEMLSITEIVLPNARKNLLGIVHPLLEKQFRYMRALRRFIEERGKGIFDYVFIPFIDDYGLAPLALSRRPFGGLPWGGIIISPRFHLGATGHAPHRLIDGVERALYSLLFRGVGDMHEIFTIDPYFQRFLGDPRLHYVPDPAAMKLPGRVQPLGEVEIADTDAPILVYGYLDHRKGIPALLRAFADPRIPLNAKLLLVGLQHESIRSLLDEPLPRLLRSQGRLVEVNRIVSDEEQAAAFHAAQIVWNHYPGSYGPSGVLVLAGQYSKPVICTQEGYCGRVVAETGMGLAVKESNPSGLVDALLALLADRSGRQSMGRAGFEHFSSFSPTAFADPIVSAIAKRLSPTNDDGMRKR